MVPNRYLKPFRRFAEPCEGTVEHWMERMDAGESAGRLAKQLWPDAAGNPTDYTESAISKRVRDFRARLRAYLRWEREYLAKLEVPARKAVRQ